MNDSNDVSWMHVVIVERRSNSLNNYKPHPYLKFITLLLMMQIGLKSKSIQKLIKRSFTRKIFLSPVCHRLPNCVFIAWQ